MSRSFLAVGSTALLLQCTAATPEPEPWVLRRPCGEPLPERCGPGGPTYLQLPSRDGLPPRPERPRRALEQPPSRRSVIELDEQEDEVSVAEDREVYLGNTPTPGTMTEGAAHAKRLFDKAMWPEAAVALERVATGEYGDDEGNRQVAEYHLAVVHFNLKHYERATDLFLLIHGDSSHNKFNEANLWLVKVVASGACRTRSVLGALIPNFDPLRTEALLEFKNPNQEPVYHLVDFLVAMARAHLGPLDTARENLHRFRDDPEYGQAARQCIDWIDAQPPGTGAR
jgi:hypothetical protein